MSDLKKYRITIEGFGWKTEKETIALLATKPAKVISVEEIIENSKGEMEK